MAIVACYLVFTEDAMSDTSPFHFHYHDVAYAGDVPEGDFVVPCAVCHVDTSQHTLVYENAIQPPDESGVIEIPN